MEILTILVAVLGIIALVAGVLIYSTLSWGYVLFKFYTWFVLPVFITLPEINYFQSVGLMLVIGLFCRYYGEGLKDEYKEKYGLAIVNVIAPWATLLFAWLIKIWFL